MRSLILMEPGITLGVRNQHFEIRKHAQILQRIRLAEVSEVLVFGSVALTPACVSQLLARGIDTVFLTLRGRYRGRLLSPGHRSAELRLAQYQRWSETPFRDRTARAVVAGKVANQRSLLLRAQRDLKNPVLADAIGQLRRALDQLGGEVSLESARGIEGAAAAAYFRGFGLCLRNSEFSFVQRTRRPPRDPVNALLSFGYTLLLSRMESAVLCAGLDPALGVFHAPETGRASLALDLIEEFRPVLVDSLVLRLINRRQLSPADFEKSLSDIPMFGSEPPVAAETEPARAVWLGETGRRVFFREWGRRLRETIYYDPLRQVRSFEDVLQLQVYHYARVVRGEDPGYRSFVPR